MNYQSIVHSAINKTFFFFKSKHLSLNQFDPLLTNKASNAFIIQSNLLQIDKVEHSSINQLDLSLMNSSCHSSITESNHSSINQSINQTTCQSIIHPTHALTNHIISVYYISAFNQIMHQSSNKNLHKRMKKDTCLIDIVSLSMALSH